jgi:hypothetical protein
MRRPQYQQDAEAAFPFAKEARSIHSYTPSVPRGATKSGEGLGRVRLLLAEMHIAARVFFLRDTWRRRPLLSIRRR